MRQSKLFTKSERTAPKDEVSLNAQLLARAGFIRKMSAGVYAYLPLGWRVIEKINAIVREEMNAIGGSEMFMPALVEKKYLDATKRWDVEIGFEVKGKKEKAANFTLGWTHEEMLTAIASHFVQSYKDLPFAAYQIQTKFRNEARAQAGLLRGREFLMKDLYSFHTSEDDLWQYYEKVKQAYTNVFTRCGLQAFYTVAGGGDFTMAHTHEFQVLADVGEDTIFLCGACGYAENAEISKLEEGGECPNCKGIVEKKRAIEVGNIFPLGTKYAEGLNLSFVDAEGKRKSVVMGSYGIGISRLMGTVAELYNDDKGLMWPEAIAPFRVHLLEFGKVSAASLYQNLQSRGIEILYDERNAAAGEKLADADLIGIPMRVVVSEKTKGGVEVRQRKEGRESQMSEKEFMNLFA